MVVALFILFSLGMINVFIGVLMMCVNHPQGVLVFGTGQLCCFAVCLIYLAAMAFWV